MMTYAMMMKSLLVVAIVVTSHAVAVEGVTAAPCCTTVSRTVVTEEILDFEIQRTDGHCVKAVIFQTATGRYCIKHNEPWVRSRILALMRARKLAKSAATATTTN